MNGSSRELLWFRHQLRIHDQPLLEGKGRPGHGAIGVWILDPREHLDYVDNFRRSGPRRLRFLIESVVELRSRLRDLGSELIIRVGHPENVLPEIAIETGATAITACSQPGTEERLIESALSSRLGDRFRLLPQESILELSDIDELSMDLPEVFSRFRRQAEKKMSFAPALASLDILSGWDLPSDFDSGAVPSFAELGYEEPVEDQRSVLDFHGGEAAGLQRLQDWMFEDDNLRNYKQTRNGMLGERYSSKFSPWLANGCLSARHVFQETLRYESERTANDSTYWLRFELLWREYFRLYMRKHGPAMFRVEGPLQSNLTWSNPEGHFEAWRDGRTGVPLIDANMIELSRTGFMSNRGRQIVASFLSKNLDVDWRLGARWFEHCLIDYCPSANWGNWTYAAGVGADPRGFRGFDVARQAANYDADGSYVSTWLGEAIASQPVQFRHAPWLNGGGEPIVDPDRSMASAKRRWEQIQEPS